MFRWHPLWPSSSAHTIFFALHTSAAQHVFFAIAEEMAMAIHRVYPRIASAMSGYCAVNSPRAPVS